MNVSSIIYEKSKIYTQCILWNIKIVYINQLYKITFTYHVFIGYRAWTEKEWWS